MALLMSFLLLHIYQIMCVQIGGTCNPIEQGSTTPRPWAGTSPQPVRNWAAQQEVSGMQAREASPATTHRSPSLTLPPEPSPPSLVLLPEPSPPSMEKLSSTKPVPGAKKFGDRCNRVKKRSLSSKTS